MQVEVDLKRMQTNFGGRDLSGFGVMGPFFLPSETAKISHQTIELKYRNFVVQFIFFVVGD